MPSPPLRRSGFVLAIVLAAMVAIGALTGALFYAATQDYRAAHATLAALRANTAAEFGLRAKLGTHWDRRWNNADPGLADLSAVDPGDGASDTLRIISLGDGLFHLTSDGWSTQGIHVPAHARLGLFVVLDLAPVHADAALVARGPVRVDHAHVHGVDSSFSPPRQGAAVSVPDSAALSVSNCDAAGCVAGLPPVELSPDAAADSTYFGVIARLAPAADQTLPDGRIVDGPAPAVSAAGCDRTVASNWGAPLDPASPCGSYWPVIHATGGLHLRGGSGQGILIVDGDLELSDGAVWHGLIVVRGALVVQGSGTRVVGTVLAGGAAGGVLVQNGAELRQGRTMVRRALAAAAGPVVPRGRAWAAIPE